jgi:hypothetical protein
VASQPNAHEGRESKLSRPRLHRSERDRRIRSSDTRTARRRGTCWSGRESKRLREARLDEASRDAKSGAQPGRQPQAGSLEASRALLQLNILQTVVFSDHKNTRLADVRASEWRQTSSAQGAIADSFQFPAASSPQDIAGSGKREADSRQR